VYPYVVATVTATPAGGFVQQGCSPNFQGEVVTLCDCKHQMRSYSVFRERAGVWVVGLTPSGVGRRGGRHLFYLTFASTRVESHADMWRTLGRVATDAKSATTQPLGDLYEPKDGALRGVGRFDPSKYRPPRNDHAHAGGWPPVWHWDINARYGRNRPMLLAGDPLESWLWSRPLIRLREPGSRLPRNPHHSPSLSDFLDRLEADR
jgi:hypothetical protein